MVLARKIAVTSSGLQKMVGLEEFLQASICRMPLFGTPRGISAVAGWGTKKSGLLAEKIAERLGISALHLEDGFLRSILPGPNERAYSLVIDAIGIYYDSTRPSELENLLNSEREMLINNASDVALARELIVSNHLSKYNYAPPLNRHLLRKDERPKVLVIDQTVNDNSVLKGSATAASFFQMLECSLQENPDSTIYVKTHPEVSLGAKKGYLTSCPAHPRVVLLREAVNPMSLVSAMDRVYTVTSTMGFEALLAGKNVTCFGIPWYSGWGATDDRQTCARRKASRNTEELFAAAYFHYSIYLNPKSGRMGNIFDVITWLKQQRPAR